MSIKDVDAKIKQLEKTLHKIFVSMGCRPVLTTEEQAKIAAHELQMQYQSMFNAICGDGAVRITVEVSEDGQVKVTEHYNQSMEALAMEVKYAHNHPRS